MSSRALLLTTLCLVLPPAARSAPPDGEYRRRIDQVRRIPGLVAFWDFVLRESGGRHRFIAHHAASDPRDYALDAANYVQEYWNQGRPATYSDFPLLGRGPFGEAIEFRNESDRDFRPVLLVPRERMHDSPLDVKGPGRSVSMVAWVVRTGGNHAIAGIWHEGTDLASAAGPVARVERGRRQYALFAGLAANNGAAAVHVSENGGASFGDRYARNLAVTRQVIPLVAGGAPDAAWSVVGFTFDNRRDQVTAYLNGKADDYWIENPQKHPFFQWPARAWLQAQAQGVSGPFPADQLYTPPETKPLARRVIRENASERVEWHQYPYTRVEVALRKDRQGRFREVVRRELTALKVNPFWFGHDLYTPSSASEGGPFTIGRVIHTSRSVGFTGYIGGVAVFSRALTPQEMQRLAAVGRGGPVALTR